MNEQLPRTIRKLEAFLVGKGLSKTSFDRSSLGEVGIRFERSALAVDVVRDRMGAWSIAAGPPDRDTYDAAILRDLLGGRGLDAICLPKQSRVITRNWDRIVEAFDPSNRADTEARLQSLLDARTKRRFPSQNIGDTR